MEIVEKGSDSEEEDTPTNPDARFASGLSEYGKTTHQWVKNSSINQKHVVNVNFDESFKAQPGIFEEDETVSIRPLFLETMKPEKEVSTLENSEKDLDQFENVEVKMVATVRPPLHKMDSSITN